MSGKRSFHLLFITCLFVSVAFMVGCVQEYEVELQAYPEDAGEISGEGTYEEGEEVTVEAEPEEGYEFEKWKEDGEKITSDKDYKLEVIDDITLEAQFEQQEYQVSLSAPKDKGKVGVEEIQNTDYEETYKYGEEVTVKAKPSDYFEFYYWEDLEGEIGSEDKSYTFQVEEDYDLVANFNPKLEEVIELSDGIEITLGDVWEQLIEYTSDRGEPQSYLNAVGVKETNKENKKSVHFGIGGYNPSIVGYVDTKTNEINLIGRAERSDKVELYWFLDNDYIIYDYTCVGTGFHHLHFHDVEKDEGVEITQMEKFEEKYDRKEPTNLHNIKWSEDGKELYFEVECKDEETTSWIFNAKEKELTLEQN
ncbi:InlB B-repeat-containing protein [Natranaerofaba carboxydovora]|uniref:InlB B-repeat-containing protein n=1 Tax=Natranaerofaba carboxydovora TaxID=2742683 RepID=UPI001F142FC9|nr:hypothetical protein [Natranaerofaba carboxydovora]UMZ75255.1 hypothetical protein ACONDI_02874 [Natranaerofaba carboxydovora]